MSYAITKEASPKYLPTEEEIAQRCELIQSGWSRQERRFRYLTARTVGSIDVDRHWTPQECRCVDFCEG